VSVKCAVCLFNLNHCVISETTFIRQQASKLDEVRRTLWIKSVHCIQKYCTIFRNPWISQKTISCTRQGRGKYFMNCRQQKRPSPCPLYCKPANPLISRSRLIEIHCTYHHKTHCLTKLCLIYKSFAVLSAPLYWCHPYITMNSQHVRMLGVHSKTHKTTIFVIFSPCIVSDHKLLV